MFHEVPDASAGDRRPLSHRGRAAGARPFLPRGLPAVLSLGLLLSSAMGSETVWRIGTPDGSFEGLSPPGDLSSWLERFPQGVEFVVGQSDPATFSSLHPGPGDHWGGRRQHPFRISFELPEVIDTLHVLRINLLDTHGHLPPMLRVKVNDVSADRLLPRGTGDLTFLRPDKGTLQTLDFVIRPEQLQQGPNVVELRIVDGFWLIYDAVALERLPEGATLDANLALRATKFFVERDGAILQEFRVAVDGLLNDAPPEVTVRDGERVLGTGRLSHAALGVAEGDVHILPADASREITATVTAGAQRGTTTLRQDPQRRWYIFIAPSTHTDIGYTHIQTDVIDLHNRNTDLALEMIEEFPLYRWNLESSWAAQMWLRDRPAYRHRELYQASRDRRLGVETSYLNMLTGLCSGEELIRNLYYSARLHRERGIPFESHTLTDAPTHVWMLPSVLAGAGVRYLSVGANQTRAPIYRHNLHHRSPFWWEGPDGGRVLTWFTAGYAQAANIGLKDGIERMRLAIETDMWWWDFRDDYPYDAVLRHGAYLDNVEIGRDIAESVTAYNERYAFPKVILGSNAAFFEHIEEHFAEHIPTLRGCAGSYWEDGAASSALETGINRVTQEKVLAAETAWAVATGVGEARGFPQARFDETWDNILLYDEHTWGAWNSISDPHTDNVQRQWAVKAAYATDAADTTDRLLDRALRMMAGRIEAEGDVILVFNPSGRTRSGVVEVDVPRGRWIVDDDGVRPQQVVHQEALRDVRVAFYAADVPPVGYRTYRLARQRGTRAVPPSRFDGNVLENDDYRVTFDVERGTVSSIIDKRRNLELVDADSPYGFGQMIYAAGGEEQPGRTQVECPDPAKITFSSPTDGSIRSDAAGPVFTNAKLPMRHEMFRTFEMETVLYEHERRIDFVFRMDKKMTFDKEAVYFAFPIAGANPRFRYEIGGGAVRPNEDHFPGACRDWFAVQRWVTVNTDDRAVAWSPIDTPLITLCDLHPGHWIDELEITNGTIFAYVMNNYWFTNYKAGQDGWHTFRYSLTSDREMDKSTASLFGEQVNAPLRAVRSRPASGRRAASDPWPATRSFLSVEPESVIVSTVKRADDRDGLIVRLRETSGRGTPVELTVNIEDVTSATLCDLIERDREPLEIADGKVRLTLGANAMVTIRLR